MRTSEPFVPAWWVPGPHLQTAWARLARSRHLITFEREVLSTPDGDELMLDHAAGPPGSPRVLLLHGLEGSAHSLHTQGLALLIARKGWRSTILNFRSCARDPSDIRRRLPNRRPRLYHSGDTHDLDLVVRTLLAREPGLSLHAIGFSLGGSVLLKWLGEAGSRQRHPRRVGHLGAVRSGGVGALSRAPHGPDLCAPLHDPAADQDAGADGGVSRRDAPSAGRPDPRRAHLRRVRQLCHRTASRLRQRRRLLSALEPVGYLARIAVPTLCISSVDDPFCPPEGITRALAAAGTSVSFEVTKRGGHVGFVAGRWPFRPIYWAEERATTWLTQAERCAQPASYKPRRPRYSPGRRCCKPSS